jgi:hypothetical protein
MGEPFSRKARDYTHFLVGCFRGGEGNWTRPSGVLRTARKGPNAGSDEDAGDNMITPRYGLRPSGGYRRLRSFQTAEIVYDGTVSFCDRFVNKRSRTHDQMVQAARSGRQNIAEGAGLLRLRARPSCGW